MARYLLVAAALLLVACSNDPGALPKVPDFKIAATTTTGLDYSDIPLKGVPGKTPTPNVVFGPGRATINGTVISDEGAVPGATIQIERFVSGASAQMTLQSTAEGTWSLPAVFGGRYRARAWRAPDLAQTAWTAVFLGSNETKSVQLRVRAVGGLGVTSSIAPDPPRLFEDTNLVVQVTLKVVDEQGVVRATPQENVRVELVTGGAWRVFSANPTATDDRGRAQWLLRCRSTGRQPLAVTVGSQTIPIEVGNCVDVTEPETTTTTSEVGIVP